MIINVDLVTYILVHSAWEQSYWQFFQLLITPHWTLFIYFLFAPPPFGVCNAKGTVHGRNIRRTLAEHNLIWRNKTVPNLTVEFIVISITAFFCPLVLAIFSPLVWALADLPQSWPRGLLIIYSPVQWPLVQHCGSEPREGFVTSRDARSSLAWDFPSEPGNPRSLISQPLTNEDSQIPTSGQVYETYTLVQGWKVS